MADIERERETQPDFFEALKIQAGKESPSTPPPNLKLPNGRVYSLGELEAIGKGNLELGFFRALANDSKVE